MHTTDAEVSAKHLSPAERREAIATILATGLLRLQTHRGSCAFPDESSHSPVVKKPSESIKNTT